MLVDEKAQLVPGISAYIHYYTDCGGCCDIAMESCVTWDPKY